MNKFLLFFVFCSGQLAAQSITGIVTQKDSGLPISDVYVKVLNSTQATVTDIHGRFKLTDPPADSRIKLSALGFADVEYEIGVDTVRIQMERSSVYLDNQIVITARRFEENQFNVAEAVSVVDGNQLRQYVPRSTPEALIGSAGIWVQKTNHGGGSPIIRGLAGNQILLLVDGIRMNNATYRYGPNQYLATIDPGLIDRMEVTRGNGSVLYGSDAIGGVVQVISKAPRFQTGSRTVRGALEGKWTSGDMEKSIRTELEWNNRKIAAHGGFSFREFGDVIAGGSLGKLSPTGYSEQAGDAKVLIRTGNNGLITSAFQIHKQREVPRYDQVQQGGYSKYDFDPQTRQLAYVRWETSGSKAVLNSIRVTGAINRTTEGVTSQKNASSEVKNQRDLVNEWSGTVEIHSVFNRGWQSQSGVEWYFDQVDSKASVKNLSTNEENKIRGSYADGATAANFAVFSAHTLDVERMSLSAGLRFNRVVLKVDDATFGSQRLSPDALIGNLGVAYNLYEDLRVVASASTGFRAPNVDDVSKFGAVESTVFEIPSGNLSPERAKTLEAGFKIDSRNFSGSAVAFYTRLHGLIERVPSSYEGNDSIENRRVYQKQNVAESDLRGIETEGEIKFSSRLSLYGNFTYTHGENTSKNEPMRRIPPAFGKLSIRYADKNGFWIHFDYASAGAQSRLSKGDVSDARISVRLKNGAMPGWNIFNLHVGYTYKSFTVAVAGQNLFDQPYRVYGSGIDGYGRSASLSLRARF